MANFPQLIQAQLRGATVRYADMARFDFKSGEVRLHQGTGKLLDGNGEEWLGIGSMGRAGPIQAGVSGGAEEVEFQLFASADMLVHLESDAEESAGRRVVRYLQFFDVRLRDGDGAWVEWTPLDAPLTIFEGIMGPLQVTRPPLQDPTEQASRIITVSALNAFVNRRKPPYAFYSHRDQLGRTNSTDNLFINASRMADAKVRWPADLA